MDFLGELMMGQILLIIALAGIVFGFCCLCDQLDKRRNKHNVSCNLVGEALDG